MQEADPQYHQLTLSVSTEFEPVFTHFYFAENKSSTAVTKTLLPSYQTIMLFCFGTNAFMTTQENTRVEVEQCVVLGPVRQTFDYTLPAGSSILVANFKDDAFYRFFGKAMISNQGTHPDELLQENCFTELWHQLSKFPSPQEKTNHILQFCRPYLQEQDETSRLLSNFENLSLNPVKTIAEQTRQSERNIQLKQKEQFGYSSKELARYNRFLKAIIFIEKELKCGKKIEWFNIIDACGYYDQSQLIHDFRHFIRISPSQYVKFQKDICRSGSE
ncbi:DNA-binding protein [Chryseobacterium shigense]|uniref:AraC-type DNA-binding protein n=1 Tax=Chryseobacterium shigense TaxID=297244 RepID=A0A1N7IME5_9FLAO|nr:AraC family transcriptional regulator [Chryseobacterium shigense]PQA95773.1 DNA-binding protein [Chryseobacterium shigense]SIS38161.1 AraC-type DNA-binding protein [Chryseobacterium shigense]